MRQVSKTPFEENEMERSRAYTALGVLLVALGGLFLLQNFGFLGNVGSFVWAALFGLGGLAFLWVFISNREHWWALIPGFALLGLAGTNFFSDQSDQDIVSGFTGGFFLGAIGMAFLVIYIIRREHWWAIIPAGALLTLALVATLSASLPGEVAGSIFFFGLAATFGALYLVPTPLDRPSWALTPAGILAIIGLMVLATGGNMIGLVVPFALMAVGGIVVLRAIVKQH
jgi:hypothetical protein